VKAIVWLYKTMRLTFSRLMPGTHMHYVPFYACPWLTVTIYTTMKQRSINGSCASYSLVQDTWSVSNSKAHCTARSEEHTQDKYRNPRSACAPRVNYSNSSANTQPQEFTARGIIIVVILGILGTFFLAITNSFANAEYLSEKLLLWQQSLVC